MKILTVVGARPQFIKAAVISRCIRLHNSSGKSSKIQEDILHTGQHYDPAMSQVFFDEMDIPKPAVNLSIGSGTHGAATGEMLKGIEKELLERKPDCLLVYGDTNSTLAGALAAAKLHIPVVHVEAGERSYNRKMPEEINRVLTDHISSILFTCSEKARKALSQEGITKNVYTVGDVMLDAFLEYLPKANWPQDVQRPIGDFIVATIHRAQNTDELDRLKGILDALSTLKNSVLLPIHPRTAKIIKQNDLRVGSNIHLLGPVPYFGILALLRDCTYVVTDSGGLQKEAYYAGKKCLVIRDETEWTELVDAGVNRLVGTNPQTVLQSETWAKSSSDIPKNIYGNGHAGAKILEILLKSPN